jgi:hypothetical protein
MNSSSRKSKPKPSSNKNISWVEKRELKNRNGEKNLKN